MVTPLHIINCFSGRAVAHPGCLERVCLASGSSRCLPAVSVLMACCKPGAEAGLCGGPGSASACFSASPVVPEQQHKSYSRAIFLRFKGNGKRKAAWLKCDMKDLEC